MKNGANDLLKYVHSSYPVGMPSITNWSPAVKAIVSEKIDGRSFSANKWKSVVTKLRGEGMQIEDLSYMQFPSLSLVIEQVSKNENLSIHKNFVIHLSLLCPFYTCYFEYKHKVNIGSGLLPLNSVVFYSSTRFDMLKCSVSRSHVLAILENEFPQYEFFDHYTLMLNNVCGCYPYGIDAVSDQADYSLFQLLFGSEQPDLSLINQ